MRAFITGSEGSLGTALRKRLACATCRYDLVQGADVCDTAMVKLAMETFRPTVVFHLAGAKHAPGGETNPREAVEVNTIGTANVVAAAPSGCRVIVASTCKAADPETAYGASKLMAERIALNAGHSVARFYNIRESAGNVFEIWDALPATDPILVTDCWRYFITMEQAVDLLLGVAAREPGRYTIDPGEPAHMAAVAHAAHPGRPIAHMPRRRGDRLAEPRKARCEALEPAGYGIERIRSPYDAR